MTTFLPHFTTPTLCSESDDPDMWFPPSGGEGSIIGARAKAVCKQCPSRDACLAYALRDRSLDGIWAGTTASDRERMRRGMDIPPRRRTTCNSGHRFTPDNTQMTARGRRCRACHNRAGAESKRRAS